MKKIKSFILVTAAVLCFTSCGMKECKCVSTNQITKNDSLIEFRTDTVSNFTRGHYHPPYFIVRRELIFVQG